MAPWPNQALSRRLSWLRARRSWSTYSVIEHSKPQAVPWAADRVAPRPWPSKSICAFCMARSLVSTVDCPAPLAPGLSDAQSTFRKKFMASWLLTLRSAKVRIWYMKESHWPTAIPNWRLTAWASKRVEWETFTALVAPCRAIARVLLQTTRTVVGMATVARVPSQEVAKSR
ncbi:hypothetical protein D3C72_1855550 [compost metagenome]